MSAIFRSFLPRAPRLARQVQLRNKSTLDSAKETLESVNTTLGQKGAEGIELGQQAAAKAKEALGVGSKEAAGTASKVAGQTQGKAAEVAGEAKGKASELAGQAKGKYEEVKSKL